MRYSFTGRTSNMQSALADWGRSTRSEEQESRMRQERIIRPRQTRRRRSERRERPLAVAPSRADRSAGADEVLRLIDDVLRDAQPVDTP